eukprot:365443-Chlamydomonas_euryale.AAC.18
MHLLFACGVLPCAFPAMAVRLQPTHPGLPWQVDDPVKRTALGYIMKAPQAFKLNRRPQLFFAHVLLRLLVVYPGGTNSQEWRMLSGVGKAEAGAASTVASGTAGCGACRCQPAPDRPRL